MKGPIPWSAMAAGLIVWLAVSVGLGCAGSGAASQTEAGSKSAGTESKLPFHESVDQGDDRSLPAVPANAKAGSATPFSVTSHGRILPAGSLITVRLESPVAVSRVQPGETFRASLAGPLTIDGETLAQRGAVVIGHIEATQSPLDQPGFAVDPGYVRLTLSAITVEGKKIDVQTSSLFAKAASSLKNVSNGSSNGSASQMRADDVIQKGRRLTFRLTSPLDFTDPNSVADGQRSQPSSQ